MFLMCVLKVKSVMLITKLEDGSTVEMQLGKHRLFD
jgi:hypothetical protein